ncbi:unnamed protein product, partial [Rotaria socialis]
MSFRVETSPHQYIDYKIFSAARFNNLGQQFLSLINPNYGTVPEENKNMPKESKPTVGENETVPNENQPPSSPPPPTTTTTNEVEPPKATSPHMIQHPSDLCRPYAQQCSYYIASQYV